MQSPLRWPQCFGIFISSKSSPYLITMCVVSKCIVIVSRQQVTALLYNKYIGQTLSEVDAKIGLTHLYLQIIS